MGKSGIYGIFNLLNGKLYVGSAINLKSRARQHKEHLEKQKHCNKYLQNSWNKYGESAFEFHVIEHCAKEKLIEREQFYINTLKSYEEGNGYNICQKAGSTLGQKPWLGKKHSEETKAKISTKNIGKSLSQETINRISMKNRGKIRTQEFKKKVSEKLKGRIISTETRKKMSISAIGNKHCLGRLLSEKTKTKMSQMQKLRFTNPLERQKTSEIHKGKIVSMETRQRLSVANKGKRLGYKHSDEAKKRMSESVKKSWKDGMWQNRRLSTYRILTEAN